MRNSSKKQLGLFGQARKATYPILAGLAVFTIYPSITAYQDIASLAPNAEHNNFVERWLAHIPQAAGVSKVLGDNTNEIVAAGIRALYGKQKYAYSNN